MTIRPRSAWGARAPKSRTSWNVASLLGFGIHWWGSPRSPLAQAGMPVVLRSVQGFHMAPGGLGVPQGGADIGYNFIVDLWGGAWEGRGWVTQTGANGTSTANRTHLAIAVAMGKGDRLTAAAKRTVLELIAEGRERGIGAQVKRHGDFVGTDCPGPDLTAWVRAGLPGAPIEEEDDVSAKDVWTFNIEAPGGGKIPASTHMARQLNTIRRIEAAVAAVALNVGCDLDPQAIAQALLASLSPDAIAEAVAEAVGPELAQAVVDELAARLSKQ